MSRQMYKEAARSSYDTEILQRHAGIVLGFCVRQKIPL